LIIFSSLPQLVVHCATLLLRRVKHRVLSVSASYHISSAVFQRADPALPYPSLRNGQYWLCQCSRDHTSCYYVHSGKMYFSSRPWGIRPVVGWVGPYTVIYPMHRYYVVEVCRYIPLSVINNKHRALHEGRGMEVRTAIYQYVP